MTKAKELRNIQIKTAVTASEKAQIDEFCEKYDITVSDLIRKAIKTKIAATAAIK